MASGIVYAPDLTRSDVLVLQNLEADIKNHTSRAKKSSSSKGPDRDGKHNDGMRNTSASFFIAGEPCR